MNYYPGAVPNRTALFLCVRVERSFTAASLSTTLAASAVAVNRKNPLHRSRPL